MPDGAAHAERRSARRPWLGGGVAAGRRLVAALRSARWPSRGAQDAPPPQREAPSPPPGFVDRNPFGFSHLTARIIALNVVALGILVGGVLYLNQYRQGLVGLKVDSLRIQAETIAVIIADTAGDPSNQTFDRILGNELLRRLSLPTGFRAQLYDRNGRIVGDTRRLSGAQVRVEVAELPPPDADRGPLEVLEDLYDRAVTLFSEKLPVYREALPAGVSRDHEVYSALRGDFDFARRANSEGEVVITVAVPIKRVATVLGAMVLSTQGGDIDEIVAEERVAILQVFLVAFGVTILVSAALAQTIARPIRALAIAAEVGGARERAPVNPERIDIPDLSSRGDEIGHLSVALRRMTSALYTRIDAIENFAADVAHEIKNPLTSLRSAVETFRLARTDEQRMRLLEVIETDVRRLDRLVTDISNASRLDAELVRQEKESFDLSQLLNGVASTSGAQAEPHGVIIKVEGADAPRPMNGLASRLAQVLNNLLDNAVSFSPEGSTILLKASNAKINRRPAVKIEVIDEGPGIPPDNLESIFDRFYSERPETEAFGNHSGLGLNICRQIAEAHGGKIWAENRTDRSGARFVAILPI